MRLYIVRHGQTVENQQKILQGHNHGTLTAEGVKQAQAVGRRLAVEHFDVIYSSDLNRALDTAKAIAAYHLDAPLSPGMLFRERDLGELQGFPVAQWNPDNIPKTVESSEDLESRAEKIVASLLSKHLHQQVLLVSHGAILGRIIKIITGKKPQDLCGETLRNTSLSIFEIAADRSYQMLLLNCTAHLSSMENCGAPEYN